MLTTNQKGALAEAAVVHEAVKLGIGVYRPVADERYDMIFGLRPRLVRVQCKLAQCYGDLVLVRLYSARRTAVGLRRTLYSAEEVDAFAAHCPERDECYFFEFHELTSRSEMRLRISPTGTTRRKA